MKNKLDQLNTQLEIINQFEALFASKNVAEFNAKLGSKDKQGSFLAYMAIDAKTKTSQAFDSFNFVNDSERGIALGFAISYLKLVISQTDENKNDFSNLNHKNANRSLSFFRLAITAFQSLKEENYNNLNSFIENTRNLIKAQKNVVIAEIQAEENKIKADKEAEITEIKAGITVGENKIKDERQQNATQAAKAFGKKALYHAGIGTLFTVGAGLTTASVLMQFSPAFSVLVGVHLPVAALATLAVSGVAMAAAAAYLAYRSYHPAAVVNQSAATDTTTAPVTVESASVAVPNPLHAKLVTAGLMTSGLHLTGFSVLMQFSPAFALLTGLQLPPVALIALAAVGALLISVAVYRLIKTNANAPKNTVETTHVDGPKQATDTWAQRFYKSLPSCRFILGGNKNENNALDIDKVGETSSPTTI